MQKTIVLLSFYGENFQENKQVEQFIHIFHDSSSMIFNLSYFESIMHVIIYSTCELL